MSIVLALQNSRKDNTRRPCIKKDAHAKQRGIWRSDEQATRRLGQESLRGDKKDANDPPPPVGTRNSRVLGSSEPALPKEMSAWRGLSQTLSAGSPNVGSREPVEKMWESLKIQNQK